MTTARRLPICVLAIMVIASAPIHAATLEHTLTFSEQDLTVETRDGFDHIRLGDHLLTQEIGAPELPLVPIQLALPPASRVTDIAVIDTESIEIIDVVHPFPAQPPRLLPVPDLSFPPKPFAQPSTARYEGTAPYPADLIRTSSITTLRGHPVIGLLVHPVQYLPESGRLRLYRSLTIAVEYEPGDEVALPRMRGGAATTSLESILANPGSTGARRSLVRNAPTLLDPGEVEYVIITAAALEADFQPLADWKTRKGVPASVITTEWIDATYAGGDGPARIRAFIADAHDTWGTEWVLLGGDSDVVPVRRTFAMDCEANYQPDDNDIPCDLYFADLDGDWNNDGDDIYGEIADGIDLLPDVFVGRASVENSAGAQTFVAKTLAYERGETTDYQLDMLMAGEILWSDPYTDSGLGLDMIDVESVPPRFDPIEKQYQSQGNESRESVIASLNDGVGHFLHNGHAWWTVLGCGDGYLDRADASGLTNALRQPLVYSIGCWPASFDKDCVAERFLENPNGGAVAFIGNSRYGWGSPGNPGYGYSDRFMAAFYRQLFLKGQHHAGTALAAAKASFIPLSQSENVYRWHQYEVNLLGDPELPLWTDTPAALNVSHPDSLPADGGPIDIVVWTSQGTLTDALVCVTNLGDVYERGRTGDDGSLSLLIETAEPHELFLTVTAADCLPYETTMAVTMSGAYLDAGTLSFDDSSGGNGDGLPGPGETVELEFPVTNLGGDVAGGVTVVLTTDDPQVTLLADTASYGDVAGGDQVPPAAPFEIEIGDDCRNGHVTILHATITATTTRETWDIALPVTVAAPVLGIASYSIDDTAGGDGDGIPEPGEEISLLVELRNDGAAAAMTPDAVLWTADPWTLVTGGSASAPSVPSAGTVPMVFALSIAPECSMPHFPELTLETVTADGLADADVLTISIGTTGFATDFEGPAIGWSHGGRNDLWTTTEHRAHSGTTSWYCGQESSWQYGNDMAAHLDSPEFVLGAQTELSFWCWYDVTIYGVDGIYVQVLEHGAPVDTLDFIGSGGALETLGSIGNDWLEYVYALPGDPGDTVQVRFLFVSDATDQAEGVYIDDVTVSSGIESSGTDVPDAEQVETLLQLDQNTPNPFTPSTTIRFALSAAVPVELSIYSIQGRLIRTLVDGLRDPGGHIVEWDGRDAAGTEVAAGVYLYRLSTGEFEETRKMILVR